MQYDYDKHVNIMKKHIKINEDYVYITVYKLTSCMYVYAYLYRNISG